ncbi:CoA transferase [Mesorhizobium atlanticum]
MVGLADLPANPDFATNPARVANRAKLRERIIETLAAWDRDPLLAKLEAAGVPASPINTIGQMFADPQTIARGMRLDLDDGHGNRLPSVRAPMVMSGTPPRSASAPRRALASTRNKSLPNWRDQDEDGRTTDRRGARGERHRPHLLRSGRILSSGA